MKRIVDKRLEIDVKKGGFNTNRKKKVTTKRESNTDSTLQRSSVEYNAVQFLYVKSLAALMGNRRTFKSLHSVNKCNPSKRNLLSHSRLEMGLFFQINFLSFSSFNSKDINLTESVRKIRALVVLIFVGVIIFSMVLIKNSQQALIRLT